MRYCSRNVVRVIAAVSTAGICLEAQHEGGTWDIYEKYLWFDLGAPVLHFARDRVCVVRYYQAFDSRVMVGPYRDIP